LSAEELITALLELDPARRACILDSGGARGDDARLLIAGFDPFETVEAYGDELHVRTQNDRLAMIKTGSVLAFLDERLASLHVEFESARELPAGGACIAALSYELAKQFGKPSRHVRVRTTANPDAVLAFFDKLVIHDYVTAETLLVGNGRSRSALIEARATLKDAAAQSRTRRRRSVPSFESRGEAKSNFTRSEYVAAVERIREHIFAGDIYQANLTQQITCLPPRDATPERVFERLRLENPAAFSAFVRLREGAIVSASPERFLRVPPSSAGDSRRIVDAWPIKGTRPRGLSTAEDEKLAAELLSSGKDTAENVMIVDLMRNDLGRVCEYGTVEVAELCSLQRHPTLFHLVSKVRGELHKDVTAGELVRATFPSGSITGAPKIRAMEIIEDNETASRGFSMGALGYFAFDGSIDLNVAIRTITFEQDGKARFNVGGGIVAESDAQAEYEESLLKARALLYALRTDLSIEG
jgi:para-aminobenzoate synthetase component 1